MVQPKIDIIQAYRGVAALGVVFWHASVWLGPYYTGIGGLLFLPAGKMGVALFFIISGFIMVYTTTKNDGSLHYYWHFMAKRIARIWPIYALGSVAAFLILTRAEGQTVSNLLLSLAFVPNQEWPTLAVGWSLNYEMYFYVLFGISLLFGRLRWIALTTYFVSTLIIAPWILSGSFSLEPPTGGPGHATSFLFLVHNPINWLFFSGVVIGLIYRTDLRIKNDAFAWGLLFASLALVAWQYAMHYRLDHGITQVGLSLFPLVLVGVIVSKSIEITLPKWMTDLGRISYSLYLFHPFVLFLYRTKVADHVTDPTGGYVHFLVVSALSVVAGAVIHRWLEEPLDRYFRAKLLAVAPERVGTPAAA